MKRVTLDLEDTTIDLLLQLVGSPAIPDGGLKAVLLHLANSAAAGVRRPGSWERSWVLQAFGDIVEPCELPCAFDESE